MKGRPISQETKLGRILARRHLRAYSVCGKAGFSTRIMTEYCAGRREITQEHLLALCRVLEVQPWEILEDMDEMDYVEELADAEQTLPAINTRSIEDIKREHRQSMKMVPLPRSMPVRKVAI